MSQSKSLLMPFIIIAILVFGGAVAWKMMGETEPEITEKTSATIEQKTRLTRR